MKKFVWIAISFLVAAQAQATSVLCSSSDSSVQARIDFGPNGAPPPGIEIRHLGYFDNNFLIVNGPALQGFQLPGTTRPNSWTWKGEFLSPKDGKNYLFVLTLNTKGQDGASDSASWFFQADQYREFTMLSCTNQTK